MTQIFQILPLEPVLRRGAGAAAGNRRMGGDGATYDIGFGALSRLLITNTDQGGCAQHRRPPIPADRPRLRLYRPGFRSHALRCGAYREAGGPQGAGVDRRFSPNVLVVQTAAAFQGHFKNLVEFLNFNASPALLDTYTSCMSEHGIADDAG